MDRKRVASISFLDNHSISMDIEEVKLIECSRPTEISDSVWVCELLIRSTNGTVALQLIADEPEKLSVTQSAGLME